MKKFVILSIALIISTAGFAQRINNARAQPIHFFDAYTQSFANGTPSGRTTAVGDTFTLTHIGAEDTTLLYTVGSDSGYVTGTNYWNDQAFAERYDFNGYDSSMEVIGVFALFGGTANPASADSINFDVWSPGDPQPITSTLQYNGFPSVVIDSQTFPITQIGIGATMDTLKQFMFATPTAFLPGSFFVGYNYNYSFDTSTGSTFTGTGITGNDIGLASSKNGERTPAAFDTLIYNVFAGVDTTLDTVINVHNATLGSDNTWYDNFTQNDSLYNNLAIYPIVVIGNSTAGVNSITKNNLTFFGNYPNPADDYTNIKFSLARNADVTIQVMDMSGRLLTTLQQSNLVTGGHIIPVATTTMPSGSYLYLVRTSGGDGIAGKMVVLHP